MALKQIKNKIVSTQKTGKVTKAMESVSAVKMRKSQERAFQSRPYVHAALRILSQLAGSQEGLAHPLAEKRTNGKSLVVIVTSDKGLAGSVNSAVLKKCDALPQLDVDYITLGRKAAEYAGRSQGVLLSSYTNISDEADVSDVVEIAKTVMEAYQSGNYKEVRVIYQNFLSTFEQEPTERTLLPLDPAEIHYIMRGIKPKTGKFSEDGAVADQKNVYTVEPSPEEVLDTLIPQLMQIMIYHAVIESKACEHSARMVAMKNATDKSKEITKELQLKYNKARQAAITAEVSEITGGIEAMK